MFVEELYEEAKNLGYVLGLRFDILLQGEEGKKLKKLCGQVLFLGQDIFICGEMQDTEHEHYKPDKKRIPLGSRPEP